MKIFFILFQGEKGEPGEPGSPGDIGPKVCLVSGSYVIISALYCAFYVDFYFRIQHAETTINPSPVT